MAKLETEHIFDGKIEQVFAAIRCYSRYPEFIRGVTSIEVLSPKAEGSVAQVRYELNIIKKFYYTLDMFEAEPNKIWWSLADSNLMKSNDGGWKLSSVKGKPEKTKAVYTLDLKFKGLVPSAITDQVAKSNLPGMFVGFQELINKTKS